jgi:hypothetical protein
MRAIVKVSDFITIEGNETKDEAELFKDIQAIQTLFEDSKCGACGSKNIRHVVREAEGFEFVEIHCKNNDCRARLSFGKGKENQKYYPKRCEVKTEGKGKGTAVKYKDGKAVYLPNHGWKVYTPEKKE